MSEPSALIEELRALADAQYLHDGPWEASAMPDDNPVVCVPSREVLGAVSVIFDADWGTSADAEFIARARSAIPELCDALESALRERDEARAKAERLGNALAGIVDEENTVGHAHERPGIWDDDNGALAGKPCHRCAAFAEARAALGDSQ